MSKTILLIFGSCMACRAIEGRFRRPTLLASVFRPHELGIGWVRVSDFPFTRTCIHVCIYTFSHLQMVVQYRKNGKFSLTATAGEVPGYICSKALLVGVSWALRLRLGDGVFKAVVERYRFRGVRGTGVPGSTTAGSSATFIGMHVKLRTNQYTCSKLKHT